MRLALILLLAAAAVGFAQQSDDPGRKRLVFPAGSSEPLATPTPAGKLPDAASVIDTFFNTMKAGRTEAAYDALVKDTVIGQRAEDVKGLKERTQQAIDNYGPIAGYETVEERAVGTCLLRRTCISLNSDLPLRWRFYFYKSNDVWRLVDLRVDDGLVELFNEVTQKK